MARGINKVIIVGNLGADPDSKAMPSGNAVTNISVATSESWKDRETGEKREKTEWHRVVFYNRLAEIAAQYLKKGSQVYVEGKLQTRKWDDKEGNERWTTEVIANQMEMLGERMSNNMSNDNASSSQSTSDNDFSTDDFDDDIPF